MLQAVHGVAWGMVQQQLGHASLVVMLWQNGAAHAVSVLQKQHESAHEDVCVRHMRLLCCCSCCDLALVPCGNHGPRLMDGVATVLPVQATTLKIRT